MRVTCEVLTPLPPPRLSVPMRLETRLALGPQQVANLPLGPKLVQHGRMTAPETGFRAGNLVSLLGAGGGVTPGEGKGP